MKPLSRQQVRQVDRYAIESVGVPGVVLMENAGRNAADAVEKHLGGAGGRSVAVVAGVGNNGGDGFVVARHLAMRGARVVTFLVAPREKLSADARTNLDIICRLKHDIRQVSGKELGSFADTLKGFDLVVDAVGGTGIDGPLRGDPAEAVRQMNASGRPVVAIDIPTGLDCDTGEPSGPTVRAVMTVTFVARKKGFDAPGAAAYTGRVVLADIGIPADLVASLSQDTAGR